MSPHANVTAAAAPTTLFTSELAHEIAVPSRGRARAGTIVTLIPVLFLVFDIVIKLLVIQPVVEAMAHLGYRVDLAPVIAIIELVCLALYLWPRTALPGAVLITGFLGGAVATHLRIGDPLLTHTLFPVYVGGLLWAGLLLRRPPLWDAVRPAARATR